MLPVVRSRPHMLKRRVTLPRAIRKLAPVPEIINEETLICIDTGCVWSGRL